MNKDENVMEKIFGKTEGEDIINIDNRWSKIESNAAQTLKYNSEIKKESKSEPKCIGDITIPNLPVIQKDFIIEHFKEKADKERYNDIEFISIVIPSYNRFDYLTEVIDSIHKNADIPFELIIHDDNSNDGTKWKLQSLYDETSAIIYSNGLNLGLAESINRAVKISNSKYILMLNADIKVEKPFFKYLISILKCPFVGFVNLITSYRDAKNKMNSEGSLFSFHRGIGGGCALAFTREVFNKVGGWNSSSCRSGNADVSFMIKTIKNGYFPADIALDESPLRNIDEGNKRSTIGGVKYDCSYPLLFNYNFNSEMSLKRAHDTNTLMQYSYRVDEGETNINYWSKFCEELINEDGTINYELSKKYGHDEWMKYEISKRLGLIYKKKDRIEFDAGELLKDLFMNYYIVQNFSELKWLTEKVKETNPSVILEVGLEKGGTLKVWEQLLPQNKDSVLIGIDLEPNLMWNINESKVDVHVIKGNSHDKSTFDEVKSILGDKKIDFVYIDGEHTPEAAKQDFEFFGLLVRNGGLVGFHDVGDVKSFLDTLPQDRLQKFYKNPPFEKYGSQMGIGTAVYYI